jgi:predicted naringenin-chalcone synthase
MPTIIEAIGTANPPYCKSQSDASEFLLRVEGVPDAVRGRLPLIFAKSAIERRFTCIADYNRDYPNFTFYPPNPSLTPAPSTAARNALYRQWAPRLAEEAAAVALAEAGRAPDEITHVIAVSCTGFYAPGLDVHLIKALGLRADVSRTIIGFMGCFAAFNALKTAHAICGSDRNARVLIVCVELCTLHFQPLTTLESAVVSALFADGAAAAVVTARPSHDASGGLAYVGGTSWLDDDSLGDMTWDISDTGFLMTLSARVPGVIARQLPAFLAGLAARYGLTATDLDFWAVHPGGRQILDKTTEALSLAPDALSDSYAILREYGNMSSPTILYILKRLLETRGAAARCGVALAFGPGLTIEGCLLRRI